MSRIGKAPITLPAGVSVTQQENVITVKGPKGTLTREVGGISFKIENGKMYLANEDNGKGGDAKYGLYRALVANMVTGVTTGFTRSLIVNGVGYKVAVQGQKLVLNIGYSHPVEIIAPAGIKFELPAPLEIVVSGIDKELVGHVAAKIKAQRVIEPYHAYGIRYKEEPVVIKEGKKAGK